MQVAALYQSVTDSIVKALEAGGLPPWRRPWQQGTTFLPLRHTGQPYRGINTLILFIESNVKGYASPYYMTFKQALAHGGCVKKGEKSVGILWCEPRTKRETADDGSEAESRFWLTKTYVVFNADQISGLPDDYYAKPVPTLDVVQRIEQVDSFISNTGAVINHGPGGAYYRPSEDVINMPNCETFESMMAYYSTLCHELQHWSGHSTRLNRDLKGQASKKEYAAEEILAEIGSLYTCAALGIMPPDIGQHAAYIQFWIEAMKADSRYIFSAASKAQQAADYLQSLQPTP